jgi:hypothetical protein
VVGDVECVEEEEPFLSIVDERPEYGSADRGLSGAMAEFLNKRSAWCCQNR